MYLNVKYLTMFIENVIDLLSESVSVQCKVTLRILKKQLENL